MLPNLEPFPNWQAYFGTKTATLHGVDIAKRLDAGLAANSVSQRGLARRLGVSSQLISQIKSGERRGTKHLPRIAEALGCDVVWLVTGSGTPPVWAQMPDPPAQYRVRETAVGYNAAPPSPTEETNRLLGLMLERMISMEERLARLETAPTTALVRKGKVG